MKNNLALICREWCQKLPLLNFKINGNPGSVCWLPFNSFSQHNLPTSHLLSLFLIRFFRRQSSESFESLLGFLASSWRNPATIRTLLRVTDHLSHLDEDAVHAGGLRPAGGRLLLQQVVGDCDTVTEWGVIIIVISTTSSSAEVLHPTSHSCQHQESYEAWINL